MSTLFSAVKLLGSAGPFAKLLTGFTPRKPQQELAQAIERALKDLTILVAEAGTGTGKTLAYLVPSLASGKKVIISTGTKNLQDQLYKRDLPLVKQALASVKKTALLKGRANYLCLYRLAQHTETAGFTNKSLWKDVNKIQHIFQHRPFSVRRCFQCRVKLSLFTSSQYLTSKLRLRKRLPSG